MVYHLTDNALNQKDNVDLLFLLLPSYGLS